MVNELLHILADPAHWAFEVITDLLFTGLGALVLRPLVRRHDAKHRPVDERGSVYDWDCDGA